MQGYLVIKIIQMRIIQISIIVAVHMEIIF